MHAHYILQYSWILRLPDCLVPDDTAPDFPASRARMRAGDKVRSFLRPRLLRLFFFARIVVVACAVVLSQLMCHPPQCCRGLPLLKRRATVFRSCWERRARAACCLFVFTCRSSIIFIKLRFTARLSIASLSLPEINSMLLRCDKLSARIACSSCLLIFFASLAKHAIAARVGTS